MIGEFVHAYAPVPLAVREERLVIFRQILALPDQPDLVSVVQTPDGPRTYGRSRRYRSGGDKYRQPLLKVELEQAYLRHRMMARLDESCVVAFRRG